MIPANLKIENFFSHKSSEIDFNKFSSALLIGNTEGDYRKSNGSGKSAIFEAILWCLFNKSRASMMDDIIRWGEATCSVVLEFKHDDETYQVKRTRNRISSTSSVEFCILDKAGEWQDISGTTSGDTNLKIESTIKLDNKTFINSVYFRQNDISEFAESESSGKKDILKSIVDISRWDDYDKASRKRARDINIECKVLKKSVENYDSVVERLQTTNIDIKEIRIQSDSFVSKKKTVTGEIESLNKKYVVIKKSLDTDTYDRVIDQIKKLKEDKKVAGERANTASESLNKYRLEKEDVESKIDVLKYKIKDKETIELPEDKLEDLRSQITHYKAQKASSEEILRTLEGVEVSSNSCYVCKQAVDTKLHKELKEKHEHKQNNYKSQLSEANKEVLSLEKEIEKCIKIDKENMEIKEVSSRIESLDYKLEIISESFEKAEKIFNDSTSLKEETKFKLKTNLEILESIKNKDFQSLRAKLRQLKDEGGDLSGKISEADKEIGKLTERASLLEEQAVRMRRDKEKISEKLERSALFDKLSKMFGRGGIQTILLDAVIEDLEKTANITLESICNEPSIIVLETQRLGADGSSIIETLDLKVRKDGHLQNFKSLSGGEKFRISLALRIALSDISSRYGGSSLEFLLMDEVNSPLDRFGVETLFINVIKSLEDRYKILVITHDESLKEKFDNVINITKVNGESELEFITK